MGSPTSLLFFLSFFLQSSSSLPSLIHFISLLFLSHRFPELQEHRRTSLPRQQVTFFLSSLLYYYFILLYLFIYYSLLMPFFHYQFFCRIIRNTPPRFQFIVLNRRSPGQSLYYMHFFLCSRFVFFQLVFCIVSHSFHLLAFSFENATIPFAYPMLSVVEQ